MRLLPALVLAAGLAAPPLLAHEAPSGWAYDWECCSTQDCAPVEEEAIKEVEGGFRVTLPRGSHRMLQTRALTAFVSHGDSRIRKSGDWHKHACVSPDGRLLCIYLPPGGA